MKKVNDDNMPIGKLTRVEDFLPSPGELVLPVATVKVTISLNRSSVRFFKGAAHKHHTKYQKMIREVLDRYASHFQAA
jgi:hypothetical protein